MRCKEVFKLELGDKEEIDDFQYAERVDDHQYKKPPVLAAARLVPQSQALPYY